MPSRHSKNSGDRSFFTNHEKIKTGHGTQVQRLGTESQLPFGYCALSSYPAEEPVISPSGHLYSRESILEYLLNKSKELKKIARLYEEQEARLSEEETRQRQIVLDEQARDFIKTNEGVISGKRKFLEEPIKSEFFDQRKKLIDETESAVRLEQLRQVSPWVPQFTPSAKEEKITEPPKRPPSPFSGQPLRTKDLIPVNLVKEGSKDSTSSVVKFICPVSRKTITNQKVILIKSTGALMLEQAAKDLAYPTMICPLTGKSFLKTDVLELVSAASGYSSSGTVEAKTHRPTLN